MSESETARSGLSNESSVKHSEGKNGSGDNNHCRSLCECVVWEWGHEGSQSRIEGTCGCSLSPSTHCLPQPCPKSLLWLPFWLSLLLQTRGAQSSCPGGTEIPVKMRTPLLLSEFESLNREPDCITTWSEPWAMAPFLASWAML